MHFLGDNKLVLSGELEKSVNILNSLDDIKNINDAIERYIIDKYLGIKYNQQFFIENLIYPIDTVRKRNKKMISQYFNRISGQDFLKTAAIVDAAYTSEYLEICINYKIYQKLKPEKLIEILNHNQFHISDFLEKKNIVNHLDKELRDVILKEIGTVELLIRHESQQSAKKLYIPQSLSHEDFNSMVKKYIESSDPNTNVLENIYRLKSDRIKLTDKIKFMAKKKYETKINEMFNSEASSLQKMGYSISISDRLDAEEHTEFTFKGNNFKYVFNKNFLENNLQLGEIVGVITYYLFLTDKQYRIVGLNNESQISALERVFSNTTGSSYSPGIAITSLNRLTNLIVLYYVNYLKKNDIGIEEVIGYFFNKYLEEKFNIKNFEFSVPSKNTDLKEKIKLLATELDSIVKQYHLMNDDRVIDQEFVNFKSNVPAYKEIRSRAPRKNIYFNSQIAKTSISMLLNDQSLLYYYDVNNYTTLENAILSGKAYLSEMREFQQEILKDLVSKGYFTLESDKVGFENYYRYSLYKDIYLHDFVSYYNLPKIYQQIIEEDLVNGHLSEDYKLLSTQEADLFDFYLTSRFSDSLGIRNKYIHGSTETNEEVLIRDYTILIRLILSLMIKIDDDLCIEDNLKQITK